MQKTELPEKFVRLNIQQTLNFGVILTTQSEGHITIIINKKYDANLPKTSN